MRFAYINGLRGIAILGVVWHHFGLGLLTGAPPMVIFGVGFQPFPLLMELWKGVDLFFILSGFVLYLPFVAGERRMEGRRDAERFYMRRAQRLLPLFFFAFLVVYCLQHKYPVSSPRFYMELVGVPSMIFQFANLGFLPPSFGPLWSIGVEILFSMLFPLLIVFRSRHSLAWLFAISLALSLAAQFSLYFFTWRSFQGGLPQHLFNFVVGMSACEIMQRPLVFRRTLGTVKRLAPVLPLGIILALLLLDVEGSTALHIGANLLFSLSAGGLVVALGTGQLPVLCTVLEARGLQLVGAMCYSIYLWHLPLLFGLFPGFPAIDWHEFVPYAPLYGVLLFAIAGLSYRYIEFPKADFRTLFFLAPQPATVVPAAITAEPAPAPVEASILPTGSTGG
jgi:peptidoglycan/LPS O-acetylase OafA/YrhL